ncbi:MAG: hypothetical protein AAFV53_33590 [Myxococcota bacterium]
MKKIHIKTSGDLLVARPPLFNKLLTGSMTVGLGAVMAGYAIVQLMEPEQGYLLAVSLTVVVMGSYFLFLRRRVELDRARQTVTARWRWLLLGGSTTQPLEGRAFRVERRRRKNDGDTTYFFDVLVGDLRLMSVSEYEGGANTAEQAAKQMADHMGTKMKKTQDSKRLRAALQAEARYALVPLLFVVAAMGVAGVLVVFGIIPLP